jgi:hypothetical protein
MMAKSVLLDLCKYGKLANMNDERSSKISSNNNCPPFAFE